MKSKSTKLKVLFTRYALIGWTTSVGFITCVGWKILFQDEELKRGSRIIRRPDRKKSFTDIANRFRKKSSSRSSSNEEQQSFQKHPIPVQIYHRPSRIAVHHHRSQMDLRLSNPDTGQRPPDSGLSSPVPICSGSPVPMNSPGGINLTAVNRRSNPVRKLRSTDDLPPEIPEENIKTLLTLGGVSSSAHHVDMAHIQGWATP